MMDLMKVYAVELANAFPERFMFCQNPTWWFLRDLEMSVMDLRSNVAPPHKELDNIWSFLGPLCNEYHVKQIIAVQDMQLVEAAFRALIDAICASLSNSSDKEAVCVK